VIAFCKSPSVQRRDDTVRLHDMLQAIDKIGRFVDGMSFEDFAGDERTTDAVIRNLEIIGEAANHVPSDIQNLNPNVPWARMRGMRNIIAHNYAGVELRFVWHAATVDIHELKSQILDILENL